MLAVAGRRRSNDFEVVCPVHPDVTLQRQRRRSFFGRGRLEVIHDECPLCREEWPVHFPNAGVDSSDHSVSQELPTPSAPYEVESPTVARPSRAFSTTTTSTVIDQKDLEEKIAEMVHSLLDRENPSRGPDFIVDQLEMLCAWSLGDTAVRRLITDVGGIYIVTNILQYCQEKHVPDRGSGGQNTEALNSSMSLSNAQPHQIHVATTMDTRTLDDASTIVTNDPEPMDQQNFDNMHGGAQRLNTLYSHPRANISSTDEASVDALSNTGTFVTNEGDSSSRLAGHTMLSYPGSYHFPPTSATVDSRDVSMMPPTTVPSQGLGSMVSPPPPTMDDIDRAFGHFLADPSSAGSATLGNTSTAGGASHSQWTASASAPMHDDQSYAATYHTGLVSHAPDSRRIPSVSGSSVSAYVSARAPGVPNLDSPLETTDADRALYEARWATGTLANLSQDESAVDVIRSAGGVETLLCTMWIFEQDEMIQDCGCECLSNLISARAAGNNVKALVVSYGAIATVLKAMKMYPATPTLQHKCCLFISSMVVGDPVVLQSIMTLEGIGLITLSMRLHRTDEALQEAACLALERLMNEGDRVYVDVVSFRGIEAILTAMWQFEQNAFIQEHGCLSIGRMCANDDGNKPMLTDAGAVGTIIVAMRRHEGKINVQKAGCLALCNLTQNYGPAVQHALDEDALSLLRKVAVHYPQQAKELRIRLYRHRSTVFKQV